MLNMLGSQCSFPGEVLSGGDGEDKSCSKVENFLKRLDDRIRCTHTETVQIINLFLVQNDSLRALVAGRSLFTLPSSGAKVLLTSDTAAPSHSSKLTSELVSLLLPTLSYSNPFRGIGCCA